MSFRQPILDTALDLFSDRGFNGTSVAELARLTGAAEGTIFHHFKSKDGLYIAVLEQVRDSFVVEVEKIRLEGRFESGLEKLEAVISLFLSLSETKSREFKLLFLGYSHKLASVNPICREHLETIYDAFVEALAEAIALGIEDRTVRSVQPEQQAMLILAMLSGVVRFRAFDLWPSTRSYQEALDFCLRALAVEESA
jgi:AcrR family transcriptional regulator